MIVREDRDRIRFLGLERPPSNVLNVELLSCLRREAEEAGRDPAVRAVVLHSRIRRYFSTGIDLAELTSLPPERQAEPFEALLGAYRILRGLPKPTVGALGGGAILGGWIMAMACDFRLLSEDGKIALSEIRFGLSPTSLLIHRLKQISGDSTRIKELVLRGKTLRADEALAGGFVDKVHPADALLGEAERLARSLAKLSPRAYASVKEALNGGDEEIYRRSLAEFRELFADPLTREGIEAMRDKRRPRWEE